MLDAFFFFTTVVLSYILVNQENGKDGSWSVSFKPTAKNFVGLALTLAMTIYLLFI